MSKRRGMKSMLTSLKMEAIEECDTEDNASVVGDDGRGGASTNADPATKSSHSHSSIGSSRSSPSSSKHSDSISRKETESSHKKSEVLASPRKESHRESHKENHPVFSSSRERPANEAAPGISSPPRKPGSVDDDSSSLTPTQETTDDESTGEAKEVGPEVGSFDMEDDACDGGLFDYDEELLSMGGDAKDFEDETLTWRLDPEQSLSDWTVVLTNKGSGEIKPYHLHKNILAVGPRKCEYFVGVFRKRAGTAANKSEISMEEPAFDCFPQFLDFVYSKDGALEVTTANATAMRHLAKIFGLKILFKLATEFLIKDISLENGVTYYKHSVLLSDEKITAMVARHAGKSILQIEPKGELVQMMDPEFFMRLMVAPEIDSKAKHYHISLLLAEYCKLNKGRMEAGVFLKLCDEKHLPLIDHTVALVMLEMEADLVMATTSVLNFSNITSLQKRCIKELSHNWKEFSELEKEEVSRVCRKLPSGVITDLLLRSLSHAKRKSEDESDKPLYVKIDKDSGHSTRSRNRDSDNSSVGSATEGGSRKHDSRGLSHAKKEYEAKIVDLNRDHQEEMAHLKKEYETNLIKLRDLCLEKDKHIANYWQELQRYQRMPNSIEGKFGPSGMMNKATKMPEIGKISADGHLYTVKSKDGSKRYPMFYYQGAEE